MYLGATIFKWMFAIYMLYGYFTNPGQTFTDTIIYIGAAWITAWLCSNWWRF